MPQFRSQPRTLPLVDLLTASWSRTKESSARVQLIGRVALAILAIIIDVRLVPKIYSARPFFTLLAFAILIFVSESSRSLPRLPLISSKRWLTFVCLHLLLVALGRQLAPALSPVSEPTVLSTPVLAALKSLLVLPTLLLLPLNTKFFRRFSSELIATAVVLLTFFPTRYFQFIWPWQSKLLTSGAAFLCQAFVPGAHLSDATSNPTLIGPSVDMVVDFSCSGITGINLFHLVFGIVVIVEWNRLNKRRALICYIVGGLAYVVANFVRLVLLFLIGNLVSKDLNLDFLGWVLFGITFYLLLKVTYDWMTSSEPQRRAAAVEAQANAA